MFEVWRNRANSNSTKLWPSTLTPKMVFIWLRAISNPDAEIKPEMTGWLRKLARKPKRNRPMVRSMPPDKNAKVIAICQYAWVPAAACSPTAAAVIRETTATGPTANTLLLPKTAYSNNGATLAYNPTSGGRPASKA